MIRRTFVPRTKVLRRLHEGLQEGRLLTLVSTPAGYGKTTTIRMWVEEAGCPVAWVTLEKSDNDLKQFLTYLLVALQQAAEPLGQDLLDQIDDTEAIPLTRIGELLINQLYDLEQPLVLVLVLEEYHPIFVQN